jgi:hypothetical protein
MRYLLTVVATVSGHDHFAIARKMLPIQLKATPMNEYRLTRNEPYLNPKCFGHTDLEARQGYYLKAETETNAIAQMSQMFPHDTAGFTVELWKPDTSAEDLEPDVDDSLPQWAGYYGNESDYWIAEYPEVINPQF